MEEVARPQPGPGIPRRSWGGPEGWHGSGRGGGGGGTSGRGRPPSPPPPVQGARRLSSGATGKWQGSPEACSPGRLEWERAAQASPGGKWGRSRSPGRSRSYSPSGRPGGWGAGHERNHYRERGRSRSSSRARRQGHAAASVGAAEGEGAPPVHASQPQQRGERMADFGRMEQRRVQDDDEAHEPAPLIKSKKIKVVLADIDPEAFYAAAKAEAAEAKRRRREAVAAGKAAAANGGGKQGQGEIGEEDGQEVRKGLGDPQQQLQEEVGVVVRKEEPLQEPQHKSGPGMHKQEQQEEQEPLVQGHEGRGKQGRQELQEEGQQQREQQQQQQRGQQEESLQNGMSGGPSSPAHIGRRPQSPAEDEEALEIVPGQGALGLGSYSDGEGARGGDWHLADVIRCPWD